MPSPAAADLSLDPAVRKAFPLLETKLYGRWPLIYFDNGASTLRAMPVLQEMERCEREGYANVHRGNHWLSESVTAEFESARETIRQFLKARDSHEIVFTSGTTAGINLVAHAWGNQRLTAGDEILLTIADHHSNIVPWQQLAARTGARVVWYDHEIENGIDPGRWAERIGPRTRLAAWPAISNVLGFRAPNRELVTLARDRGVVTLIDAAQHVSHEATDVSAWGADFTVFSGHKMFGPTGIGILHGKLEQLEAMEPFLGGGSMIETVSRTGFVAGRLPARFEAGTPPIVQAIGLAAAARFLESCGLDRIAAHEAKLTAAAMAGLQNITGLQLFGPPANQHAGLLAFSVEQVHSQDLGKMLDLRGVATRAGHHCTMPLHDHLGVSNTLRASFALYNTLEEVQQFLEHLATAIKKLRA